MKALQNLLPLFMILMTVPLRADDGVAPLRVAVMTATSADAHLAEMIFKNLPQEPSLRKALPVYIDRSAHLTFAEHLLQTSARTDIDAILVLGVPEAVMALRMELDKSLIAGLPHDPSLFGIAFDEMGRSGKVGVNFVTPGERTARDLFLFQQLVPAKNVTVLLQDSIEQDEVLKNRLRVIGTTLGIEIEVIAVGKNPSGVVAKLSAATQAVYAGPLRALETNARAALFAELTRKGLPTFAMAGLADVDRGAFAGALSDGEERLAKRLADHLGALLRGERMENLPAWLPARERLTINGSSANGLGMKASLELRLLADMTHMDAPGEGRQLSLRGAIETALADNTQLAAQREEVSAMGYEKRIARSALLPHISAAAAYQRNDRKTPQVEAGFSAEANEQVSLQADQVIFDNGTFTQVRVARENLKGSLAQLQAGELEIVNLTVNAFLNVLSAEALLDIEIENLKLTRSNLRTARARLKLGAGGNEEVYRWESQEAGQLGDVYRAQAQVTGAKAGLARLLGNGMNTRWSLKPVALSADETVFLDPRWNQMLGRNGPALETCLLQLARDRSPDRHAAESRTRITKLLKRGAGRSFYLPSLSLSADYRRVLDEEFAPGATPLFPSVDQSTWNLTLSAGIPLFNGGRRLHELGKARVQHRQALHLAEQTNEGVDERLLRALAATRASEPNRGLTQRAADRAARSLEIVLNKYEQGQSSILDLLEAQDQDLSLQRGAALANYTHLANLFALQRALSYYDLLLPPDQRAEWLADLEVRVARAGKDTQRGVTP